MLKTTTVLTRFSFSLMFLATRNFAETGCSSQHIFQTQFKKTTVSVNQGDLTEEASDAIGDILHVQ